MIGVHQNCYETPRLRSYIPPTQKLTLTKKKKGQSDPINAMTYSRYKIGSTKYIFAILENSSVGEPRLSEMCQPKSTTRERDCAFFTGLVCVGTEFHTFHGATGYGIIRDYALFTAPRDNPETRTIPWDSSCGKHTGSPRRWCYGRGSTPIFITAPFEATRASGT